MKLILGIALAATVSACGGGGSSAAAPASYAVSVSASQPATIAAEGLSLQLVNVVDGRCPREVQCVRAGQAEVSLGIKLGDGATAAMTLGIPAGEGRAANQASYQSLSFTLTALDPAPPPTGTPLGSYRASLLVERSY